MNELNDRISMAIARVIYATYYEYLSGRSVELADGDVERRVARLTSYTKKHLENDHSRLEGLKGGQQWNDQLAAELVALKRKKEKLKDIHLRGSEIGMVDTRHNYLYPRKMEFVLWKEFFSSGDHFLAVLLGISKYENKLATAMLRIGFLPVIYAAFSALFELSTLAFLIGALVLAYYVGSRCVKFICIFTES